MQAWKHFACGLIAAIFGLFAWGSAKAAIDDAAFDRLLGRYVVQSQDGVNRVRYADWKASKPDVAALEAYIKGIEATPISKLSRDAQFAAWANLYNAITIRVILRSYPVKSIRDIKSTGSLSPKALLGPWETKVATIEGKKYSLDEIEHSTLRAKFKDPRVHYAVNCASFGCPNLQTKAWRAATLSADLDAAARAYIGNPRGVSITADGLQLSGIYDWFKSDFGPNEAGLLAHLSKYSSPAQVAKIAAAPGIAGYGYDWSLNEIRSAK